MKTELVNLMGKMLKHKRAMKSSSCLASSSFRHHKLPGVESDRSREKRKGESLSGVRTRRGGELLPVSETSKYNSKTRGMGLGRALRGGHSRLQRELMEVEEEEALVRREKETPALTGDALELKEEEEEVKKEALVSKPKRGRPAKQQKETANRADDENLSSVDGSYTGEVVLTPNERVLSKLKKEKQMDSKKQAAALQSAELDDELVSNASSSLSERSSSSSVSSGDKRARRDTKIPRKSRMRSPRSRLMAELEELESMVDYDDKMLQLRRKGKSADEKLNVDKKDAKQSSKSTTSKENESKNELIYLGGSKYMKSGLCSSF
eukprot:GDKJ01005019.1.p1 GENE.GDKJ01005019.1~~GDKJ01005019.1.p1  ORF type:complete len:344 (+),score=114.69 GDKJ01005019.1:66-1034(+)